MPEEPAWHDLGAIDDLKDPPLRAVTVGRKKLALSWTDGQFGVIDGVCNHVGGPLGDGRLDGQYVVCPWHHWKFHARTGRGEPGFEEDAVPAYETRVQDGRLWVNLAAASKRTRKPHAPHPLARRVERAPGPVRVAGISTTVMNSENARFSTSEHLLEVALEHAATGLGAQSQCVRLRELAFRPCEGYYSKSAHACTWPCSITQMDPNDQLDRVYEAIVHWADVFLVATPIRWGAASSLYYKMAERMNCIQNQITIADRVLLRNKVVAFVITGGQDNIQAVAGQMLTFFTELGCVTPQFPFIAHSRGWSAEDMERNVAHVARSEELRAGAQALVERAVALAGVLIAADAAPSQTARGGRKAHGLDPAGSA